MKTVLHASIFLTVMLLQSAFAGPWPRKAGSGFYQVGFSTIGYKKVYNDASDKQALNANVRDNVVQLFGDYGITQRLTVSGFLPFKFLSYEPIGTAIQATNGGLGDIQMAGRYNWLNRDGDVLSTELLISLPTGSVDDTNGLYLGSGVTDIVARVMFGHSWRDIPMYLSADLAFDYRTGNFSHTIFTNVEAGYSFLQSRLYVILLLNIRESLSNEPTLPTNAPPSDVKASSLGLLTSNQEYFGITPKILYKFAPHWGAVVSFGTALHGRNIAGGFVWAGSVFYEY